MPHLKVKDSLRNLEPALAGFVYDKRLHQSTLETLNRRHSEALEAQRLGMPGAAYLRATVEKFYQAVLNDDWRALESLVMRLSPTG